MESTHEGRKLRRKTVWLIIVLILSLAIALSTFRLNRIMPSVSAVETAGNISVYWDRACTKRVSSIDWGNLTADKIKEIVVYVRNEGNESAILVETATAWNPTDASRYLFFSYYCQNEKLSPGTVASVTQRLRIAASVQGISRFSFSITLEGRKYYQGDVNKDGTVDMTDLSSVIVAVSSGWNAAADLNSDGTVDMLDFDILIRDFGKSNT